MLAPVTHNLTVQQRPLDHTGLTIPAIAFGAGPVSALMTDAAARDRQRTTIQQALALGVDWFDTAATYGNGASETSLGWALRELGANRSVRIGTKVRLGAEQLADILGAVRASVEGSLQRLGVNSVALLQLHNSITRQRGDQPTSITPDDVLCSGGVLQAFEQLRREGLVQHCGLTRLGDEESLNQVLKTESWATMQVNLNLCERSAGLRPGADATTAKDSPGRRPALLAIRVFAGGALAGKPPSAHTLTTKFFPLPVYERDLRHAEAMRLLLPADISLPEAAVRFAVHHEQVTSAIIGFGSPEEVEDAVRWAANGPLPDELVATLTRAGV
jgi:aryl-alcohol dehydrogenase-like predicted oxidoreductase